MATYEATIHPLAFAHMEGGVKTVYVVPDKGEVAMICSGDRLEDEAIGSITVGMVRRYPDLTQMMEAEGFGNVIPEAQDVAQAISLIEGTSEWNPGEVNDCGVLALRVRHAKRKS